MLFIVDRCMHVHVTVSPVPAVQKAVPPYNVLVLKSVSPYPQKCAPPVAVAAFQPSTASCNQAAPAGLLAVQFPLPSHRAQQQKGGQRRREAEDDDGRNADGHKHVQVPARVALLRHVTLPVAVPPRGLCVKQVYGESAKTHMLRCTRKLKQAHVNAKVDCL